MWLATKQAKEEEEEWIRCEMGLDTQSEDDSEEEGSVPVEGDMPVEEDEEEGLTAAFAFELLHESVVPGLGVYSETFCDHSDQC